MVRPAWVASSLPGNPECDWAGSGAEEHLGALGEQAIIVRANIAPNGAVLAGVAPRLKLCVSRRVRRGR